MARSGQGTGYGDKRQWPRRPARRRRRKRLAETASGNRTAMARTIPMSRPEQPGHVSGGKWAGPMAPRGGQAWWQRPSAEQSLAMTGGIRRRWTGIGGQVLEMAREMDLVERDWHGNWRNGVGGRELVDRDSAARELLWPIRGGVVRSHHMPTARWQSCPVVRARPPPAGTRVVGRQVHRQCCCRCRRSRRKLRRPCGGDTRARAPSVRPDGYIVGQPPRERASRRASRRSRQTAPLWPGSAAGRMGTVPTPPPEET